VIRSVDGQNDVASMHETITAGSGACSTTKCRGGRTRPRRAAARRPGHRPPRKFAYAPGLVVVDGGPAGRGRRSRRSASSASSTSRVRAGQAARGGLGCPDEESRWCCPAPARGLTCCSASATRRTGSPSPITAPAAAGRWSRARWTTCPAGRGAPQGAAHPFGSLKRSARARSTRSPGARDRSHAPRRRSRHCCRQPAPVIVARLRTTPAVNTATGEILDAQPTRSP
jgi:hypothetical protein